jgi:hypothetical protein
MTYRVMWIAWEHSSVLKFWKFATWSIRTAPHVQWGVKGTFVLFECSVVRLFVVLSRRKLTVNTHYFLLNPIYCININTTCFSLLNNHHQVFHNFEFKLNKVFKGFVCRVKSV